MDPITALILASLLTWGTAGGGIKDTAAILKGQTPPSYAYRTAKLAASERQRRAESALVDRALAEGKPLPAALEPRRIRIKDLARHWWEDALEDADHWRATRHGSRAERKAARAAWKEEKKTLVAKGYGVLKERGEKRFGAGDEDAPAPASVPDSGASGGEEAPAPEPPGSAGVGDVFGTAPAPEPSDVAEKEVPDNVVPLRRKTSKAKAPETTGTDRGLPGGDEDRLGEALAAHVEAADEYERAMEGEAEPSAPAPGTETEAAPPTETPAPKKENLMSLSLTDKSGLAAHLDALASYATYNDSLAASKERLAAGMAEAKMGASPVGAVDAAGQANRNASIKIRAAAEALREANAGVAEARRTETEAADGTYLDRR